MLGKLSTLPVDERRGSETTPADHLDLRPGIKSKRLKVHVRSGIHNELDGLGLAHMPPEIPDDQDAVLRVIKKGTPAAKLIAAARRVSAAHPDDDQLIRDAVGGDAKTTLQEIREMVCA
jgi:hypothetical protein